MSSEQIGQWAAKYVDGLHLFPNDEEALKAARHNQACSQGMVTEVGVTDVPDASGYVAWLLHRDGSISLLAPECCVFVAESAHAGVQ